MAKITITNNSDINANWIQQEIQEYKKDHNIVGANIEEIKDIKLSNDITDVKSPIKSIDYKINDSEANEIFERYESQLIDLTTQAVKGQIERKTFESVMGRIVKLHILLAFLKGTQKEIDYITDSLYALGIVPEIDESVLNRLSNEAKLKLQEITNPSIASISSISTDIWAGLYDDKEQQSIIIDSSNSQLSANEGLIRLKKRIELWINQCVSAYFAGMLFGDDLVYLQWVLGVTDEHCEDCFYFSRQIHTAKEWLEIGYRPRSSTLACKGFYCDCRFVIVDLEDMNDLLKSDLSQDSLKHGHHNQLSHGNRYGRAPSLARARRVRQSEGGIAEWNKFKEKYRLLNPKKPTDSKKEIVSTDKKIGKYPLIKKRIEKAPKEFAESIISADIIDTIQKAIPDQSVRVEDFVYNAFQYNDPITGIHSSIHTVELAWDGGFSVGGNVFDKEGNNIGAFDRRIYPNGKIEQEYFKIDLANRGDGFGRRFYQNQEETYASAGFKEVEIHANINVGGYAWARMGYDFKYESDLILNNRRLIREYSGNYDVDLPFTPQHSWEIASYKGPNGEPIGKSLMLGTDWIATKKLDADSEGYQIGQAYYNAEK